MPPRSSKVTITSLAPLLWRARAIVLGALADELEVEWFDVAVGRNQPSARPPCEVPSTTDLVVPEP